MYWHVNVFNNVPLLFVLSATIVILSFFIIGSRYWQHATGGGSLHRAGARFIFSVFFILLTIFLIYSSNVNENIILMEIKDNEPTVMVLREG